MGLNLLCKAMPCGCNIYSGCDHVLVSFPDPTLKEGKGLCTLKHFLGLVHHHVIQYEPMKMVV